MSEHDRINDKLAKDLMNLYGQQLAWPCEIEAGSFDKKTLKLKMLTIDYVVSDGTHWLCKSPPAQPAQRTWVGSGDLEDSNAYIDDWTSPAQPLLQTAAATLQEACHGAAKQAGWWADIKTGKSITANPYCFSNKLMLIVSEIAEAMEGDRKGLQDDKLPHRTMREVELADAVIRIFDLAGAYGMDLGGAISEKMAFNSHRADHKIENRSADGGKAY